MDGGLEEGEGVGLLDGEVFGGEGARGGGGGLDEDVLAVEAEAFACDFGVGDFDGEKGLDGVDEELDAVRMGLLVGVEGVESPPAAADSGYAPVGFSCSPRVNCFVRRPKMEWDGAERPGLGVLKQVPFS